MTFTGEFDFWPLGFKDPYGRSPTDFSWVEPDAAEVVDGFKPNYDEPAEQPLSNTLQPLTAATITVRVIKSFEYRTFKALVMREVNLQELTVGNLMGMVREGQPSFLHLTPLCPARYRASEKQGSKRDSDVDDLLSYQDRSGFQAIPDFAAWWVFHLARHPIRIPGNWKGE